MTGITLQDGVSEINKYFQKYCRPSKVRNASLISQHSVMLKAAYSTVRTGRVKKNMGISGSRKPGRKNKMIDAISNMLGMALIFTIAYLSYLIGRQDAGKNEKRKK